MDHGDRRSGAAAGRTWRSGGGGGAAGVGVPAPPKVYRVEPRDFRELVQRLTGAGTPGQQAAHHQRVTPAPAMAQSPAMVADSRRAAQATAAPLPGPTAEQFDYATWFSAPLLSPAYGYGGAQGYQHQHQGSSGPLL